MQLLPPGRQENKAKPMGKPFHCLHCLFQPPPTPIRIPQPHQKSAMVSPPSSQLLALLAALLLLLLLPFFFTLITNFPDHLRLLPYPNFVPSAPRHPEGFSVLLTGATSFALKDPAHEPLLLKPSREPYHIFIVESDLDDARLFCKLYEMVPFAHIVHLAAQSNIDGFVNLLDIANAANPLWASSSSISCSVTENPFSEFHRTSSIHSKDDRTIMARAPISRPRRHCQADRTAPLNKRIQERANFAKSIPSKQVTSVGVERFHGDPNIPEKEAMNELGKSDDEGMNVEKQKYYKQFPDMHRLGRRLLQHKGSSPTPRLVAVSRASGPVTPSGPSPCTRIPIGKGHC